MTVQLETQARVTVDNGQAVQALDQTKRAADTTTRALGNGSRSATAASQQTVAALQRQGQAAAAAAKQITAAANRQRAAYQQLGFQISDVAAQATAGTNPMIIFAQQGGQVAQALAGFGGVIGRVAGFLAGPFGAAVLGAGAILGVLASRSRESANASDDVADAARRQKEALKELDNLATRQAENEESRIERLGREAAARLATAAATRREIDSKIALLLVEEQSALRRANDPTQAGEGGFNAAIAAAGSARSRIAALEEQRKANARAAAEDLARVRAAQFAAAQKAAKVATDALAAATQRYNQEVERLKAAQLAGKLSQDQVTAGLIAAENALAKARENARKSSPAAPSNRRADNAAARAAERELARQIKLTEDLAKARRNFDATGGRSLVQLLEQAERARADDPLRRSVDAIEKRRAQERENGRAFASAAQAALMQRIDTVARLFGDEAGKAFGIANGLLTGDFRGVPGRAGAALYAIAGNRGFQENVAKPIIDKLGKIFGDEAFAKTLGKVLDKVAFGAAVGSVVGGGSKESQVGGAFGSVAGASIGGVVAGPLGAAVGQAAGAILGSIVGGLFAKTKTGSVSLSGSGGEIVQGGAVGSGGSQRQNASALASSFTDALSQIANALGGEIGNFKVSIGQSGKFFRVDTTGQGRTNKKRSGVEAFGEDAGAAVQFALADAIRDGAIAGVSPRVQQALQRYASDVNRAVAEALKVQDLENQLADRLNPFATVFRDFERQAKERLRVARQYGFDLVEIERLNAEQRNKLVTDSIANVASSARTLLDELKFGSRSEGSITERLDRLGGERARLQGLVEGGDLDQIDKLAQVIQQQIDLSREAFGSTGRFADDRNSSIATLEAVIRQAEQRAEDAQLAALRQTNDQLAEANTTLDEQTRIQQAMLSALQGLGAGGFGGIAFDPGAFQRVGLS